MVLVDDAQPGGPGVLHGVLGDGRVVQGDHAEVTGKLFYARLALHGRAGRGGCRWPAASSSKNTRWPSPVSVIVVNASKASLVAWNLIEMLPSEIQYWCSP